MITGVSIYIHFHHDTKEMNTAVVDTPKHPPITSSIPPITASQQVKLENVISEIFLPLADGAVVKEERDPGDVQNNNNTSKENKPYVAYLSNPPIGAKRKGISEDDLESDYLQNIKDYDIFIYYRSVMKNIKSKGYENDSKSTVTVEIDESIFNLLVLFLKYKNINLPFLPLYNKSWAKSIYRESSVTARSVTDSLKNAICKLRASFKDTPFTIPHARGGGYTCHGNFKSCLILDKSSDKWFSLDLD